ncbi:MAG: rRNA pseudouridine synthase [Phycisphaerales bacterium]|nr:rRNA pseudouridine synthase [Phycisphaerales bacterium]
MRERRIARNQDSHEFTDSSRGERLQRVMADAGVASRRECEALILAGEVSVNGHLVNTLPAWVDFQSDDIRVGGTRLKPVEQHVYIVLFKPRGVVCTNSDPEGRPRAIDLIKHPLNTRLYCVGRLDLDSSGLLFLTNDGELANRLTHPRYEVHKGYEVVLGGSIDAADLRSLEEGIFLPDRDGEGSRTSRSELRLLKRDREKTTIYMELREGRNRQIRRMMQRVGHPVKKLRRVKFGPIQLKGLAVGEWRELMSAELRTLRRAAGLLPSRPGHAPKNQARTGARATRQEANLIAPKSGMKSAIKSATRNLGAGIDFDSGAHILSTAKARANPKDAAPTKATPRSSPKPASKAPVHRERGRETTRGESRGTTRAAPRSAPRGKPTGKSSGKSRGNARGSR